MPRLKSLVFFCICLKAYRIRKEDINDIINNLNFYSVHSNHFSTASPVKLRYIALFLPYVQTIF